MFTDKPRIYIVENYFATKSYQKDISLFEYKFLSDSLPNKLSISCLVKKFYEEGAVKNLPHQRRCQVYFTRTPIFEFWAQTRRTVGARIFFLSAPPLTLIYQTHQRGARWNDRTPIFEFWAQTLKIVSASLERPFFSLVHPSYACISKASKEAWWNDRTLICEFWSQSLRIVGASLAHAFISLMHPSTVLCTIINW